VLFARQDREDARPNGAGAEHADDDVAHALALGDRAAREAQPGQRDA
jgi:hypothetical protein